MDKRQIQRGDVYYIDLGKLHNGSIQDGYRPCVIIQNNIGNKYSPCVIVCPLTSRGKKPIPTHVNVGIEDGLAFESIILCEQMQTRCKTEIKTFICHLNDKKMNEINKALAISIGLELKEVI